MARSTLPHLINSRGAMVNVSSINAAIPSTGPVGYSEAKASLNAPLRRHSDGRSIESWPAFALLAWMTGRVWPRSTTLAGRR